MTTNKYSNFSMDKFRRERLKGKNNILVFQSLLNFDMISVNDISESTGLSVPTILSALNELNKLGWIEKKGLGINKGGGRRPELYSLISHLFYIVCIDIDLFMVKIAIYDNTLQPIHEIKTIPYSLSKNRESFKEILDIILDVINNSKIDKEKFVGVSMCMPGLTNNKIGENLSYLISKNDNLTIQEYCSQYISLPVIIQNDVNAACLGEIKMGKAKKNKNALVLLMDWGVGLGIIMDGKVQEGASGYTGEIGHISLENNGSLCYCGKRGCLETTASGMALTKMAKDGINSGQNTMLQLMANGDNENINPHMIVSAANQGDLFSIKLLSNVGETMGKIISILIQIFNPEIIILEGKIALAGEYITIPMLQSINTYCMMQIREKTEIVSSNLGEQANLIGCAVKGIAHFLEGTTMNAL